MNMTDELRELLRYKDLLKQLVIRDLKVRYKNSILGFFWSLANPLVQVATITVVVKYIMRMDIPNYSAYLLVGYLPWVFFQMALLDSSQVVVMHRDLLRKVYFPREVLPISVVIANLIHFLLALVIFFAYLMFYYLFLHSAPIAKTALMLPALIAMQTLLIVGLTFFVSCLNVFYEDTKYILTAGLNVLFYLTPVMYVTELVYTKIPEASRGLLYKLYLLNPLNMLTDAYRKTLLPPYSGGIKGQDIHSLSLDYWMLAVCAAVCVVVAIAGYAFFNARKWVFAERI
ncbi:MAG: ABC transporter permease [Armatimonadetes bacterium]|nr:ABC transporter permease [Armatimonadota bacterium]